MTPDEIRAQILVFTEKLKGAKTKRWRQEYETQILKLQADLGWELDRLEKRQLDECNHEGELTKNALSQRHGALLGAVSRLAGSELEFHEALAWLRDEWLRRQRKGR